MQTGQERVGFTRSQPVQFECASARFALEKPEAALAETIAEELGAAKGDPTPRVVAAMELSIERILMDDSRAAVLRGDASAPAKRKLRRICDAAFELLKVGVHDYGRRVKGR